MVEPEREMFILLYLLICDEEMVVVMVMMKVLCWLDMVMGYLIQTIS